MIVTFISQCEKNALKKTRRVLDAFANRIGDNTWQTVITNDGLGAVKKLLRKTASKNTAVSCHWMRSRSRSELAWIVGKRDKFDGHGNVPVNFTRRELLHTQIENDWHYLPLIKALVAIAALFHDWGKASQLFQDKLNPDNKVGFKGDPIRHEWISVLLLTTLIGNDNAVISDSDWLTPLAEGNIDEAELKNKIKAQQATKPLTDLPPMAKLVAWLIVSHHRLPLCNDTDRYKGECTESMDQILRLITKEWGYENRFDEQEYQARLNACFQFPKGLISQSKPWLKQIKKWGQRLLDNQTLATQCLDDGCYRLILNHARLCLMLGDHFYSSQEADKGWQGCSKLFANTDRETHALKQKLDEHLVGVAKSGLKTAHLLPAFEQEPPMARDINSLKKLSPKAYRWQDKAVNNIKTWQLTQPKQRCGFFAVNMASTGCGKTIANAKVMRALSDDGNSLRFILALGLRTLTLQTGDEYRERIGLDNSELAVLIGSRAVMALHQQAKLDNKKASFENSGSASQEQLLDEEVDYDCAIPEQGLTTVLTCDRDRQFLYAPVLSCTIDHMMAATETKRGGRYILPTLRLMSSDLVIDEIDDFTGFDLIAIGRLIHLAGMLGRKVMISSATIPPDLAEGYFKAYRDGWLIYCKTRNASATVGCAWIDEFNTQAVSNSELTTPDSIKAYRQSHAQFIDKRVKNLKKEKPQRKADISRCQHIIDSHAGQAPQEQEVINSKQSAYFRVVIDSILNKHQHHQTQDQASALNVSFGVVRMANISPCVDLAKHLLEHQWPEDTQVRVMAYHSQQVLLLRSNQECHLDEVLKRKEKPDQQPQAFTNLIIRRHLDQIKNHDSDVKNVVFIVVATPVEEVGRDHDFDWAVIEPSSYRSIIQLAGRVHRHRKGKVEQPNISLLQYNWKGIRDYHLVNHKVFNHPGFEDNLKLNSHDLNQLVDVPAIANRLDAIPRIEKPTHLTANVLRALEKADSLAELEHAATWSWLSNYKLKGPHTLQGYLNEAWFLTALPQKLTPFRQSTPSLKSYLVFMPETAQYKFCERNELGYPIDRESALNIHRIELSASAMDKLWLTRDFSLAVETMAEQQEISRRSISLRYGELEMPDNERQHYAYNDQLGLVKI